MIGEKQPLTRNSTLFEQNIPRAFPDLKSKRLVLREFSLEDAQDVFDIFSRAEVTQYHNLASMTSPKEAEKLITSRKSLFEHQMGVRWALALKEQPHKAIGSVGFFAMNREYHSAEIGYDLHPEFWHQGYMTEAVIAALNFGYSDQFFFALNRVEAITYPEHNASIRLLRRLGFMEEGLRREFGFWKESFHDLRAFSLLRRDWITRDT